MNQQDEISLQQNQWEVSISPEFLHESRESTYWILLSFATNLKERKLGHALGWMGVERSDPGGVCLSNPSAEGADVSP